MRLTLVGRGARSLVFDPDISKTRRRTPVIWTGAFREDELDWLTKTLSCREGRVRRLRARRQQMTPDVTASEQTAAAGVADSMTNPGPERSLLLTAAAIDSASTAHRRPSKGGETRG